LQKQVQKGTGPVEDRTKQRKRTFTRTTSFTPRLPLDPIQQHFTHTEEEITSRYCHSASRTAGGTEGPASQWKLPDLKAGPYNVVVFDGMHSHYGRGNLQEEPRVVLHLVFVQKKLLSFETGRREIAEQYQPNGINASRDKISIFDVRTPVGRLVHQGLLELGLTASS
jgi:hypothetical protein